MAKNKVKKQDWEIVDVKPSKIEGKGLFTKKSLKKGDVIGLAHVDGEPTETIGNYHNHSDNPNAESILIGNNRYLIASKNLKPNQEITVDYRKQPELEQPEDFEGSSVTEYPIMQAGGRTPILGTQQQYQAYQDSLNAYNSSIKRLPLLEKAAYDKYGSDRWIMENDIKNINKTNPKYVPKFQNRGYNPINFNITSNSTAGNTNKESIEYSYTKPVQPVVYKEKDIIKTIQPLPLNLIKTNPINQELDTIPFSNYFSRPRQLQNIGQGKTDYFDKNTGELLGTYEEGGELPEAGGGYRVIRSNERKGKTHKVIGPDGTVKFFGDSKLGQHPKDPARKKAFYARHAKNLKNNPYFRAFARKTWEEGGELNDWEILNTAQDGKYLKDNDSTLENLVEFVDPTGLSSWDDVYRSYQNTGLSPQTGLEVLGALPLLGKIGKSGKVIAGGFDALTTLAPLLKNNPKALNALFDIYKGYKNIGGDKLDKALGYTTQLLVDNTKLFNPVYRANSPAAINTINKIEKAARLSKAKDFIPTSEYKPYLDYQQPIVPIDNTRVATPVIPIKTERPYIQKAPLPRQSVPTMDFAQGGMLPDLAAMAFGGNLILERYADGGSTWEIVDDNEWEIVNETPNYQQGGKVVSEIWQDVTGTPWSEAKKLGLTKGGYEENLAIRSELLKNPEKFVSLVKGYSQQPTTEQIKSPPQQPKLTYKWSEQPVTTPILATIDTPITPTTLTKPLPNLPLITNPIDSPYFQAPIESTKVVPQMIKKPVQQPKKQSENSLHFDNFALDLYKNTLSKVGKIGESIEDYSEKVKEIASTIQKEGLENAKQQLVNYMKTPESYNTTPKSYTPKKQSVISKNSISVPNEEELDSYKETVEVDKDFTINTFSKKLQNKKIGVRNRMDESDIKGNPLFYTYAPFKTYNEHLGNSYGNIKINKNTDNTPVIAYQGDKIIAGKLGDYKNTNALISPTHKIDNVSELIIDNNNKYNEGIKQKMIKLKTSKGNKDLPIGVKDSSSNKFESWSGGHLLVENPNTGELTVLHGKSNQLKEMFSKFLKQNNLKTANILETDHKAYSLIKTPKSGVMKGSYNRMLDNYNTAESGSGNFVYEY